MLLGENPARYYNQKKGLEEELQQKKISIYVPLKKEGLYLKTHLW